MVIKMIKILFSIILSLFLFQNAYSADAHGQPTQYEVTMKKVELCTDLACTSPFIPWRKKYGCRYCAN